MLSCERVKGKDRCCIAVVHDAHHPAGGARAILGAMAGEVLAFPQAPDGVEIRHLRAFVAVAEDLNFGRAAARLYLSQPALSRQIRALERLLGCELLRRSTHRVELTVAGSALLDRARKLLADLDEAIATTQSVGGELANRMATLWAPVLEMTQRRSRRRGDAHRLRDVPGPGAGARERRGAAGQRGRRLVARARARPRRAGLGVLYLHGGGYTVGSAYGYRPLVGALVAAAGVGALVPDYRLAPEHPFPAALEDALSAYRWLAEQRGADQIVLAGDSVGGGLVCSLLLTLRAQEQPLPAGAVLLCPGVDLSGESTRATPTPPRPRSSAARSTATSRATRSTTRSSARCAPTSAGCRRCSSRPRPGTTCSTSHARSSSAPPRTASTRGSRSSPPRRTSSTSSGRSSPRPPTRSSRRASFIRERREPLRAAQ